MTADSRPPVKATGTSNRVLEALIDADGATLPDLVDRLPFSKSSIHNHLSTLEQLGFVVREGRSYRVSLRFLEIGTHACNRYPLYLAGRSGIGQLSSATGLSASLLVLERGQLICLYTAAAADVGEPIVDDGDVLPLHCTAPGKAVLAETSSETVSTLLSSADLTAFTENTLTTTAALQDAFDGIRAQGWAADREEWQSDVRGIATAVSDTEGTLHGAICVTGRADSLSGKRFAQDVPGMLISTANEIKTTL